MGKMKINNSVYGSIPSKVCLTIICLCFNLTAIAGVEIDGLMYNLDAETQTATVLPNQVFNPKNITLETKYAGDIIIPETVTSDNVIYTVTAIDKEAFSGASEVTSIVIPKTISKIGLSAFKNCSSLADVYIDDLAAWCRVEIETDYNATQSSSPFTYGANLYVGEKLITDLVIPDGVTSVRDCTFYGSNIKSIAIPNTVEAIGSYAFYKTKISSLVIPESVKTIGERAFSWCKALSRIVLPNSCTDIGDCLFYGCSSLSSVVLPDCLKKITSSMFRECTSLASIDIPASVTTIGFCAFRECTSLTSVLFPDGLISIDERAFQNCTHLTSVTFPEGLEKIGVSAFYKCSGLAIVELPDGLTTLGEAAFEACTSLTSVEIPANLVEFKQDLFANCDKLSEVTFQQGLKKIGAAWFMNCTNLKKVDIPNSVTSIQDAAFYGCSNLYRVIIGRGVTDIGLQAFGECTSLSQLYCKPTIPPYGSLTKDVFNNVEVKIARFYVPEESMADYKAHDTWKGFLTMYAIPTYPLIYNVDGELYKSYDMMEGDLIKAEPFPEKEGYTFLGWTGLPELMPDQTVVVTGFFKKNPLGKCPTPIVTLSEGGINFSCEMEGVTFHYELTLSDNTTGEGSHVELPNSYIVSVYASKEEYEDSDVATMTFQSPSANGDFNCDGVVNAADVVILVNKVMTSSNERSEQNVTE